MPDYSGQVHAHAYVKGTRHACDDDRRRGRRDRDDDDDREVHFVGTPQGFDEDESQHNRRGVYDLALDQSLSPTNSTVVLSTQPVFERDGDDRDEGDDDRGREDDEEDDDEEGDDEEGDDEEGDDDEREEDDAEDDERDEDTERDEEENERLCHDKDDFDCDHKCDRVISTSAVWVNLEDEEEDDDRSVESGCSIKRVYTFVHTRNKRGELRIRLSNRVNFSILVLMRPE